MRSYIVKFFLEIANYLREGDTLWDGQEIIEAITALNNAKSLAFKDVENHFMRRKKMITMFILICVNSSSKLLKEYSQK